ncbi:MAG: class I SAM-dependent methyltransferase [Candidatus Tumulicola sp.]
MNPSLYDLIYSGLARSAAYRSALSDGSFDLPEWVVPLSSVHRAVLERLAAELEVSENDEFVDLACGLGGPGLWIAQRTGANVVGIDFSEVAIREARRVAEEIGMSSHATFVVADATRTGLPRSGFAAVVSIDSLQFIDAGAAAVEIARILQPGGRAVITTWEKLTTVEVPTVVRDYRPYFQAAGLNVLNVEELGDARDRELAHYRAMLKRADLLRAEMRDGAEPILHEADVGVRRGSDPPRVRKVLIVARKPEGSFR